MFKKIFLLALCATVFSTVFSLVYMNIYFSQIVDFSESFGISTVFVNSLVVFMVATFVTFGINTLIKKEVLAKLVFNLILTVVTFLMVFYVLKQDDPSFKNEDAQIMVDYYKCYLMPLVFFPALSWFTLKPLFSF